MRECIVARQLVVMTPIFLLADGGNPNVDLHQPRYRHSHRVDIVSPLNHHLSPATATAAGPPLRIPLCRDSHRLAVPLDSQRVSAVVPVGALLGRDHEGVGVEHYSERLHPRVVAGAPRRPGADEVRIDVEVVVRDNGEVAALGAVEVEHHSVPTNKAWVVAQGTEAVALRPPP